MECMCRAVTKEPSDFHIGADQVVKPPHVCSGCYWKATVSTDMDFLEQYHRAAVVSESEVVLRTCRRCRNEMSDVFFSYDKSREDGKAVICKDCNKDACELSRAKKRIWAEEDEHYEVPCGMGASGAKRLRAMYKKLPDVEDARVYKSLLDLYEEHVKSLRLPEQTGKHSLRYVLPILFN